MLQKSCLLRDADASPKAVVSYDLFNRCFHIATLNRREPGATDEPVLKAREEARVRLSVLPFLYSAVLNTAHRKQYNRYYEKTVHYNG